MSPSGQWTSLLLAMGNCLGYDFDEVHVKKGAYYPKGLGNVEEEQHALRRGLLDVIGGKRRIPVGVFEEKFPALSIRPPEMTGEALPAAEESSAKKLLR